MKSHKRCPKLHIIEVINTTLNVKCPWCKVINQHTLDETYYCDGQWSELSGFSEYCCYCKKKFYWEKDKGIGKGDLP